MPGNHDLWTLPTEPDHLRGEAKYRRLVALCREHGVLTPEDPYVTWPGDDQGHILAPTFVLYDYSFRPDSVPVEQALEWAAEENLLCSDEVLLHADPFASKIDWCHERVRLTEPRLAEAAGRGPLILINHFPCARTSPCSPASPASPSGAAPHPADRRLAPPLSREVVVYGHLHIRATHYRDGVRFEESSLGYPQNWDTGRGIAPYLRQILPHRDGAAATPPRSSHPDY